MSLSYSDLERIASLEHRIEDLEGQVRLLMDMVRERAAPAQLSAGSSALFDIILTQYPPTMKINVIKVIREVTGLGLKEAKEMSESLPCKIKSGVSASEQEQIIRAFMETKAVLDTVSCVR